MYLVFNPHNLNYTYFFLTQNRTSKPKPDKQKDEKQQGNCGHFCLLSIYFMKKSKSHRLYHYVVSVALKKFGFKEIAPEKGLCDVSNIFIWIIVF